MRIRDLININNDDIHYEALEAHQRKYDKAKDTQKDPSIFITRATVPVQLEDGGCGLIV